jgi:glyceraldehyde-3-phosphate dehydrogenase (ferredoxin)
MKVLKVNLSYESVEVDEVSDERITGALEFSIDYHLNVLKSYRKDVYHEDNAVIIGCSPFSFPGSGRAIVVFRSPLHGSIHCSTIGGLGRYVKSLGVCAVVIEGRASELSTLKIKSCEEIEIVEGKEIEKSSVYTSHYALKYNHACLKHGIDFAGRGGAGSVLVRAHNLIAVTFPSTPREEEISSSVVKKEIEAGERYRKDGTFKAVFSKSKEYTAMMNYAPFLLSREERLRLWERYVAGMLLKDYSPSNSTCGERCAIACKKIERVKVDYEPFCALGSFIGVFDRKLASILVEKVDSMCLDAIHTGYLLSFMLENIENGFIELEDVKATPSFKKVDVEENFKAAREILDKNLLVTSLRFPETGVRDLAFYIPFGDSFEMTPNFYPSFGLLLNLPMHGKYYTDYSVAYHNPEEYARMCFERSVREFELDNKCICRFHRKWVEKELRFDKSRISYWLLKLYEYKERACAEFRWFESARVISVLLTLLKELGNVENASEEMLTNYWKEWEESYFSLLRGAEEDGNNSG